MFGARFKVFVCMPSHQRWTTHVLWHAAVIYSWLPGMPTQHTGFSQIQVQWVSNTLSDIVCFKCLLIRNLPCCCWWCWCCRYSIYVDVCLNTKNPTYIHIQCHVGTTQQGLFPVYVRLCCLRWPLIMNAFLQMAYWYGLSPVCVTLCFLTLPAWLNAWQTTHWSGFSPVCINLCVLRSTAWVNVFLQMPYS